MCLSSPTVEVNESVAEVKIDPLPELEEEAVDNIVPAESTREENKQERLDIEAKEFITMSNLQGMSAVKAYETIKGFGYDVVMEASNSKLDMTSDILFMTENGDADDGEWLVEEYFMDGSRKVILVVSSRWIRQNAPHLL